MTTSQQRIREEEAKTDGEPENVETRAVSHELIARRAYSLYLERNQEDGYDVEDWLQAEREILEETSPLNVQEADLH